MGQNALPPVNIPIPTKTGSKMGGEFTNPNQNGTIGVVFGFSEPRLGVAELRGRPLVGGLAEDQGPALMGHPGNGGPRGPRLQDVGLQHLEPGRNQPSASKKWNKLVLPSVLKPKDQGPFLLRNAFIYWNPFRNREFLPMGPSPASSMFTPLLQQAPVGFQPKKLAQGPNLHRTSTHS